MNHNQANINTFFENLSKVLDKNKFEPHNEYDADGTLVTVCVAVNSTENYVPPMFVLQEKTLVTIFSRWTNRLYTGKKSIWWDARRRKYSTKIIVHQIKKNGFVLSV
jgi:hypothetical protein